MNVINRAYINTKHVLIVIYVVIIVFDLLAYIYKLIVVSWRNKN